MPTAESHELTDLARRAFVEGDPGSRQRLFELLHDELLQMATYFMDGERSDHSWSPSDLAQECVSNLLQHPLKKVPSRKYVFAALRQQMRRLLIDHARHKATCKAGGHLRRSMLDEEITKLQSDLRDLATWDEFEHALCALEASDQLRYDVLTASICCCLEIRHISALLGVSASRVRSALAAARAFIYSRLCAPREAADEH